MLPKGTSGKSGGSFLGKGAEKNGKNGWGSGFNGTWQMDEIRTADEYRVYMISGSFGGVFSRCFREVGGNGVVERVTAMEKEAQCYFPRKRVN